MKKWFEKMERKITAMTWERRPERRPLSMSWWLFMASKLYGRIVAFRLRLYGKGTLRSRKLPCFVISVGNITAGGSGKTPMTLYLAEMLKKNGMQPVVISRGYGGTFEKERRAVVAGDGENVLFSPREVGDEPFMMASRRSFPVVVCRDRFQGGMAAVRQFDRNSDTDFGSEDSLNDSAAIIQGPCTGKLVLILDDGFQHVQLKRDLDIVLMDFENPYGNGALLPAGRLREPIKGLKRADLLLFTRCQEGASLKNAPLSIPSFFTRHLSILIRYIPAVKGETSFKKEQIDTVGDLKKKRAMLFSGIAQNAAFRTSLKNLGITIVEHLEFRDHHLYKSEEILQIFDTFHRCGADLLITTEKDHARLGFCNEWPMDLAVMGVSIEFMAPEMKEKFDALILSNIEKIKPREQSYGER